MMNQLRDPALLFYGTPVFLGKQGSYQELSSAVCTNRDDNGRAADRIADRVPSIVLC
jgi:hypothetical protein